MQRDVIPSSSSTRVKSRMGSTVVRLRCASPPSPNHPHPRHQPHRKQHLRQSRGCPQSIPKEPLPSIACKRHMNGSRFRQVRRNRLDPGADRAFTRHSGRCRHRKRVHRAGATPGIDTIDLLQVYDVRRGARNRSPAQGVLQRRQHFPGHWPDESGTVGATRWPGARVCRRQYHDHGQAGGQSQGRRPREDIRTTTPAARVLQVQPPGGEPFTHHPRHFALQAALRANLAMGFQGFADIPVEIRIVQEPDFLADPRVDTFIRDGFRAPTKIIRVCGHLPPHVSRWPSQPPAPCPAGRMTSRLFKSLATNFRHTIRRW